MAFLRARNDVRLLGQALFLAGALTAGCRQSDEPQTPASRVESAAQKQALAAPTPASKSPRSITPTEPANDGLDELKQALARRFDRAQMLTQPVSPQGGIHYIPNGLAEHATVLVKYPDGTVRKECVSSSAEVSALVEQVRKGGVQ
jgi:hypothetical protein